MDDLPESSGSWYDDLEMDPDPHEEEVIGTPDPTDFWVNGVAQTIISISGIIGNIICLTILLRHRHHLNFAPAFANLLVLLSLFYLFTLAAGLVDYSAPELSADFKAYHSPIFMVYTYPLLQIAYSGSAYTLMAISVERYLNISNNNKTVWHHMWRGWGYIILVIVLAVLFNLHHFFELTYGTYDQSYCNVTNEGSGSEGESGCWSSGSILYLAPTALKMDPIYNNLSIGCNIIGGFVSVILLALLSCKTFSIIKANLRTHAKDRCSSYRDGAMVDILVGLVAIFIICNIPHLVLATYEMLFSLISNNDTIMYNGWRVVAAKLTNLLLSGSHTLNIFVFCCQDKMFRALLLGQRVEVSGDAALT